MDESGNDDFRAFTDVIKNRFYNSGYREGLFKAKSEVIQSAFDEGYEDGALYSLLSSIKSAFCEQSESTVNKDFESLNLELIKSEIKSMKDEISETIPEIKIATLLHKS